MIGLGATFVVIVVSIMYIMKSRMQARGKIYFFSVSS